MTKSTERGRRRRVAWLLGGVVVPLVLFFVLAANIGEVWMTAFDEGALRAVEHVHGATATMAMRFTTFFGGFLGATPLALALAGILVALRRRRDAVFVIAVVGGAGIVQYVAKLAFARPRPSVFPALVDVSTTSFPSGHATVSASLGLVLRSACTAASYASAITRGSTTLSLLCGASALSSLPSSSRSRAASAKA